MSIKDNTLPSLIRQIKYRTNVSTNETIVCVYNNLNENLFYKHHIRIKSCPITIGVHKNSR